VLLSGGLDSRAILAAMSESVSPLHAVTFGQRDAPDVRIAARAAGVRGTIHHVQELTEHSWLAPRFEGVWWLDGHLNLLDVHGMGGYDERREWFDINLSGFLGDVTMGGSYSRKTGGGGEIDLIRNRGRRLITYGLKAAATYFENRIPFFDNDLLEFTLSIPETQRARDHVYADMLLKRFPEFFKKIPWQETGVPITWPLPLAYQFERGHNLWSRALHRFGVGSGHTRYADYNSWLRHEPARSQIGSILTAKDAIYPEYVDRGVVVGVWEDLQRGAPISREVGLYATLEIWLQQVFNARYRTAPAQDATL
jgi:asparagine synthase (glutamine-hydrolysing)